jgi:hypothetical protein
MDLRLGMNVVKGEDVVVFIHFLTGNLAPQDFGKNVLGVVGHGLKSKKGFWMNRLMVVFFNLTND